MNPCGLRILKDESFESIATTVTTPEEMFDSIDLNNNGYVTLSEWIEYLKVIEVEEDSFLSKLFSSSSVSSSLSKAVEMKIEPTNTVEDGNFEVEAKDANATGKAELNSVVFCPPPTSYVSPRRFFFIDSKCADSTSTEGRCQIAVLILRRSNAKATLLYSHGNSEDLGMIQTRLRKLSRVLNVNIMAYDYSGYGQSTGKEQISNDKYFCLFCLYR